MSSERSFVVGVQLLSHDQFFASPWTTACQASLSFTISWSLQKLMSIESVMTSNHLIHCCPLLLLPPIFPSIRVFSSELALHIRWPKYWSFNSQAVLPMNIQGWFPLGLTGLISLLSKGLSRAFSSTTFQNHQFLGAQLSLLSNFHIHTWLLEKPQLWLSGPLSAKWCHLNGGKFEQTLEDSEGQGSLACFCPWVAKSQTWLSNWTTTISYLCLCFSVASHKMQPLLPL